MESIWTTPCGFHDHSIPFHIYFIVKVHSLYTIPYGIHGIHPFHMEHGGECKVHDRVYDAPCSGRAFPPLAMSLGFRLLLLLVLLVLVLQQLHLTSCWSAFNTCHLHELAGVLWVLWTGFWAVWVVRISVW